MQNLHRPEQIVQWLWTLWARFAPQAHCHHREVAIAMPQMAHK